MIGKKLKASRIKNGFTQKELGSLIGVSARTISNYEHDKYDVPRKRRIQFCFYLKDSAAFLFDTEIFSTSNNSKAEFTKKEISFLLEFIRAWSVKSQN